MSPWDAACATAAVSSSPRRAERIRSDTTECLLSSFPSEGGSHLILGPMRRMAFLLVLPAAPSADTAARRTPNLETIQAPPSPGGREGVGEGGRGGEGPLPGEDDPRRPFGQPGDGLGIVAVVPVVEVGLQVDPGAPAFQ